MYTGKSSRNPNMSLIWGVLICIGFIAFGIYLYFDLAAWENSNDQMRMNSLLWLVYDVAGKLGVVGLFSLVGLVSLFSGYKKTKEQKEIIKQARTTNTTSGPIQKEE